MSKTTLALMYAARILMFIQINRVVICMTDLVCIRLHRVKAL